MQIYHLAEFPQRICDSFANKTVLKHYNEETQHWDKLTGDDFRRGVINVAKAFNQIGLKPEERVGIYSQNMVRYLYTEFGIYMMRGVSVPLYATASPEQVQFVVEDADIQTLFVGEQFQYNNAFYVQQQSDQIKRIVIFDENVILHPEDKTSIFFNEFVRLGDSMHNEVAAKVSAANALVTDLAVIIYTSGTQGKSKGVMLHHSNFIHQLTVHTKMFDFITSRDTSLCALPLSHIFEKAWTYYCLSQGVTVAILSNPKKILQALPKVKPTLMCNVPRFWEKVYAGVQQKIDDSPKFLQHLYRHALKIGNRYRVEYETRGKRAPLGLTLLFQFYDKMVFSQIKRVLGLGQGRFFPTAGAPLSTEINVFLQSVNFPIICGYGLTESTATVSCYSRNKFDISSVGDIVPELEVKIDPENNEILLKGASISSGYFNNPQTNQESFTLDGFFRTGDAGRIEGKTLYFTERIKDLFKTANGKYVAPQMIEGLLLNDPIIEQVATIGDTYKFVSALIYPNWGVLRKKLAERGVSVDNRTAEDLAEDHEVNRLLMGHIEIAQASLARFEKVKRITILTEPFSIENGLLTNTLKLKRKVINERYAKEIEEMYNETYDVTEHLEEFIHNR